METEIDMKVFNALIELTGEDFIGELIDTFLDEASSIFDGLKSSLAGQDAEVFRRSAHSMKSSANTFGALKLGEMSRQLEILGRENRLDEVGDALEHLEAEYQKVSQALLQLRGA